MDGPVHDLTAFDGRAYFIVPSNGPNNRPPLYDYTGRTFDRFPPDLAALVRSRHPDLNLFRNPRGATPAPPAGLTDEQQAEWVTSSTDYAYLGAGRYYAPNLVVVA
jgi:hypothetical protein